MHQVPRRERAEMYLEVFGNLMLRPRTATYVASRAVALRHLLEGGDGPLGNSAPRGGTIRPEELLTSALLLPRLLGETLDVSLLKMKERDALEDALRSYAEDAPFDAVRCHDDRLRRYYGSRYDARSNVLDWDYGMELSPIAPIVHKVLSRWHRTPQRGSVVRRPPPLSRRNTASGG